MSDKTNNTTPFGTERISWNAKFTEPPIHGLSPHYVQYFDSVFERAKDTHSTPTVDDFDSLFRRADERYMREAGPLISHAIERRVSFEERVAWAMLRYVAALSL